MTKHVTHAEHQAVLLNEATAALAIRPEGVYVDCTFGRGGHSQAILSALNQKGRLIAFDQDEAAAMAAAWLSEKDARFTFIRRNFTYFDVELDRLGLEQVDGVLMDLGVSSPQLDDPQRGFSFRVNAPLDMRMDTSCGLSAQEWLACATEKEITEVIKTYGEERFARKIAKAIVAQRQLAPIKTTHELAVLIGENVHSYETGQNPATRTFQAIRIFINGELDALRTTLPQVARRLKNAGRLVVISFHSLEDRIVKHYLRTMSQADTYPKWVMLRAAEIGLAPLSLVGRAVRASTAEIADNPRARSAIMRSVERSSAPWPEC